MTALRLREEAAEVQRLRAEVASLRVEVTRLADQVALVAARLSEGGDGQERLW